MSDNLAAAAVALGLPEALVSRSAEARAAETGVSAEDILAQWAGGEAAPTDAGEVGVADATPAQESVRAPLSEQKAAPVEPTTPEVVIEVPTRPSAPAPQPAAAGPYKPPVLVGAPDNPMTVFLGAIGLFLVVLMVGLVGPSIAEDIPGARSSEIAYSATAEDGRAVYATQGCASCHTQMVRPIIADVGIGAVTLNDSNQVLGTRRFGPDLSDVGTRISASQLEAIVGGLGRHPAHTLSEDDMSALVAYLSESRTSMEPEEVES